MVLQVLRAVFILLMAAAGYFYIQHADPAALPVWMRDWTWLALAVAVVLAVTITCIDILAPRKKLAIFSGTFLGLLVGLVIAYGLSFMVTLVVEQFVASGLDTEQRRYLIQFVTLLLGITACYFSISFILQTKDDFRFIIPYVEFSKQTKGARPFLLDSNVLIDARILDISRTGILESQLIVPRFIQDELRRLADSGDKMIRARGRRGLEALTKLKEVGVPEVVDYDASAREENGATDEDHRLIMLAKELNARVLTNDYNLNKVAQLRGVNVVNLNELANAMKPQVMPGEKMIVHVLKAGEAAGQGVGYLDDGTMVVIEGGRPHLDHEVEFTVTNTRQTVQGRMIFGRMEKPV